MYIKNKNYKRGTTLYRIIISLGLLLFFLLSSLYFFVTSDISLNTISKAYTKKQVNIKRTAMDNKIIISGNFRATEDYLGTVSIKFKKKPKTVRKTSYFRIKEDGADNPVYQTPYQNASVYYFEYFSFGFPVDTNSKGVHYSFELETSKAKTNEVLEISDSDPVIILRYQFPRASIYKDRSHFTYWIISKVKFGLLNENAIKLSLLFLLPFVFYISFLFLPAKYYSRFTKRFIMAEFKSNRLRYPLLYLVLLLIFINIFFMSDNPPITTLFILGLIVLFMLKYKLSFSFAFSATMSLSLFTTFLLIIQLDNYAARSATWVYYWMVIAITQIGISILKIERSNNFKKP